MSNGKQIIPEIVLQLTEEQIKKVLPIHNKRKMLNAGIILGSLGLNGDTVALSYHSQAVGEQIIEIAAQALNEGETNVNS